MDTCLANSASSVSLGLPRFAGVFTVDEAAGDTAGDDKLSLQESIISRVPELY